MSTEQIDQYITILATWNSQSSCCPKCGAMNGKTWTIKPEDLDIGLIDDVYGLVYDTKTDQPVTHPNCMCWVYFEVQIDLDKLGQSLDLQGITT